jgi:hypothetical protein
MRQETQYSGGLTIIQPLHEPLVIEHSFALLIRHQLRLESNLHRNLVAILLSNNRADDRTLLLPKGVSSDAVGDSEQH